MANKDQPRGLRPHGPLIRVREYTAGALCAIGAPVAMQADGKVDPSAGDPLLGVAISYASADAQKVLVADHPDQEFIIQADDASIDAQTDIGGNFDLVNATSAHGTYTKLSIAELDGDTSDAHTAADNPLKLVRIEERSDNALGTNVDCVVIINNHQLGKGAASAAV